MRYEMKIKLITMIAAAVLFLGSSAVVLGVSSEGAGETAVIDGTGEIFMYPEPAEHVVTMGYASTLTVAMLGEIGKIIAVDTYSTYSYTKDERLKDLDAVNLGSIYTASNNDLIVTKLIQWVDEGKMNLDDTIILTAYSNALVLREQLNAVGFDKVLVYLSVTGYDDIIDFVKSMSIVVTGKISPIVDRMGLVKVTIDNTLAGVTDKAKGLGVWYTISTSEFTVCNTGSIAASLIDTAGGINVAYNPGNSSTTYGNASFIVQLVEENPGVVIFLSDNYTRNHTVDDFRKEVLGGDKSIPILVIDSRWNNYDPDAADGLWAFACALYPDLFEGDAPSTDDGVSGSNLLLYAAAGIISAICILGISYAFIRRP
jgi:ABC-type Fe3+-hydroxamate transport system substrate-binding protein